ncbi:hypothetical protein CR983_03900 [Candidatus Saccharibacteria bacterium]|nr:MAG: hypothetical protein CR983_03900 [Candidatus Saccharibacteria bacterium]
MDANTEQSLIDIYRNAFINSYEEGGGYGYRFHHGVRVMTYCKKFLELEEFKDRDDIDTTVLLAGALFHDIGKVKAMKADGEIVYESEADKHHETIGSEIIADYIGNVITDPATMKRIETVILESGDNTKQSTIESKLVKDADRLDNYGYHVVWRHITGTTYNKRTDNILDLERYWVQTGAKERAKRYLEQFNFDTIRAIAAARYDDFNHLIDKIRAEIAGDDIVDTERS